MQGSTPQLQGQLITPQLITPQLITPQLITPQLTTPQLTTPQLTAPQLTLPRCCFWTHNLVTMTVMYKVETILSGDIYTCRFCLAVSLHPLPGYQTVSLWSSASWL